MSDETLNVNLQGDDALNITLHNDSLEIDINSMIETSELAVNLQTDDTLGVNLENDRDLEVSLAEGIPIPMDDYNPLRNHPSINNVELIHDKSFEDLGQYKITNQQIKDIVDEQYNIIFGGNNNG